MGMEMAAGGVPGGGAIFSSSPSRSSGGGRLRGAAGARASADRLVARLQAELGAVQARLSAAEDTLGLLVGSGEAAQRVQALLPALLSRLAGRCPAWLDVLRRNVALHSDAAGMNIATAGASELRRAQRGPRLESQAEWDVLPRPAGNWEPLPLQPEVSGASCPNADAGIRCTCGAVAFSSAFLGPPRQEPKEGEYTPVEAVQQPRPMLRADVDAFVPLESLHSELYGLRVVAWARGRTVRRVQPFVHRRRRLDSFDDVADYISERLAELEQWNTTLTASAPQPCLGRRKRLDKSWGAKPVSADDCKQS
ncbi:unnamed protein product [Prorocentrum cordatum]|uniref:Uncharacterized protein n=1 Tax=Prorocentrum cordatum TaxID=2364126 RepID=A0ABN9QX76_9DINO|nr:unnamed protein product [Polarella glacialis]